MLTFLPGISCDRALSQTPPPDSDVAGAEVLTRGPVHEAFAGIVTFNPEPGIVSPKAPPEVIEEVPPEERPEGDNVSWIPGYWAWDDERNDFVWISGTWRALPPGREWIAGYWGKTTQGYQWTSGYWADSAARATTYLPAPPATLEVGPNIAAPSIDYGWSPGCWLWYQGRYAWRPGYWVQGRADWDWCPGHYVWTPRGYIFVGGFWDYPVERRGLLFAPVYFQAGVYSRRGYFYSPTIVISLGVFSDHLFLRPHYSHYYFGDYYADSYFQGGFYASFSFQSGRRGYDPIFEHQRWQHRQDREWEHRMQSSYQNRRDHENERPPRTWAAQRQIKPTLADSNQNRRQLAAPISQLAKQKDSPLHLQPVAKDERQKIARRGQEVQKSRDERRTMEAGSAVSTARNPGTSIEPSKGQLPRSPIVGKPVNQLGRNQIPPKAQQSPKLDLKVQPKSEPSGRTPGVERSKAQPEPRKPELQQQPAPTRNETAPRERPAQEESQPRSKNSGVNSPEQSQRNANESPITTRLESQQPEKEPMAKVQAEPQSNNRPAVEPARQVSQQPVRERSTAGRERRQQTAQRQSSASEQIKTN